MSVIDFNNYGYTGYDRVSVVNIEPNNFCNLKCDSCADDKTRPTGFITPELCEKVASQCSRKEIRLFMSGEPLFHPSIGELIKISRRYSNKVVIHTNATMLTEKKANEIIDAGLTHLSISFDGLTKEEYEGNRVGANFEEVSNNIRTFISLNKNRVHLTIQRIVKLGQEQVPLTALFSGAQFYPVIIRHSWNVKDKINGHKPENLYEKQCFFLWNYLPILWNGDVCLCCADLNGKCIIGDANKDSLTDIWNGPIMTDIRRRMLDRKPIPEICSGCERYNL